MNKSIKLKSIQFKEINKDFIEIEANALKLDNFNLLIGDNAQGKSRLLRILKYLSTLTSSDSRIIQTNLICNMTFELDLESSKKNISYKLDIQYEEGKNVFDEEIKADRVMVYSTKKKLLLNEVENKEISNPFIPKNIPSINAITDEDYISIRAIHDFFSRIVYVSADKAREIAFNENTFIPNPMGTNISAVLLNWSEKYPAIYNEVTTEFINCFKFITGLGIVTRPINNIPIPILTMNEKGIPKSIEFLNWSDGMYRFMHLIMSTKVPFSEGTKKPSLVMMDEIENGFDFKTLKYLLNYLQDYSDEIQVAVTSHSPLVCDFVHPKDWIVLKRTGSVLNFYSPRDQESNLDDSLELFKQKHWEFYSRHISNSKSYE